MGFRKTTVVKVNPPRLQSDWGWGQKSLIELKSGYCLEDDQQIKVISLIQKNYWCSLNEYALVEGSVEDPIVPAVLERANVISNIIAKNAQIAQEKAEEDGFAPMDLLHKFGSKSKRIWHI